MARKPSPALVISIIALFVALGGSAAAIKLGKNTVKTKSIKNGAVSAAKLGKDVRAYAKVTAAGVLITSQSMGVLGVSRSPGVAPGTYCIDVAFQPHVGTVTLTDTESDKAGHMQIPAILGCPNAEATVFTVDATPGSFGGSLTDESFFVIFN
jgi:hypothetical protein